MRGLGKHSANSMPNFNLDKVTENLINLLKFSSEEQN